MYDVNSAGRVDLKKRGEEEPRKEEKSVIRNLQSEKKCEKEKEVHREKTIYCGDFLGESPSCVEGGEIAKSPKAV